MNRISRLFVASCAGVALTFTASPALAAHTDDGGKGAHVEQRELVFPDGTEEYRNVIKHHGDDNITEYARVTTDYQYENKQYSFDWNWHYTELENVTMLSSQATSTENGETCHLKSLSVIAHGQIRTDRWSETGDCPEPPISE